MSAEATPKSKIKLGPFELDHPFILAPMAGITNSPFRRLMRRQGSAIMISELISANGMEYANQRTKHMLSFFEDERILGLQIFGDRPEYLVKACQRVEAEGADFVDLNLGCPVPKVVKKGAGCAMARDPLMLEQILKLMVRSVKIPVTIKIRTGWDANSRIALEVVEAAHQAGVAWVAIHGRTRAQGYSGEADWDFIGDIKAKSAVPIIGNGDLFTAEKAVERYQQYGVDAVLIGRGALRNPFIFNQAADLLAGREPQTPGAEDFFDLMDRQRTYLEQSFEGRMAMVHARKFLAWYTTGYPGCHAFRRKVFTIQDGGELWDEAHRFFESSVRGRDMSFLQEPFLMGGHG